MTKRPVKTNGVYHINGQTYKAVKGSRQLVWHETAYKTQGLLVKSDLMMNKWGRIVSKKKHATAKQENRLKKHGWGTEKHKFGPVRLSVLARRRTRRRQH